MDPMKKSFALEMVFFRDIPRIHFGQVGGQIILFSGMSLQLCLLRRPLSSISVLSVNFLASVGRRQRFLATGQDLSLLTLCPIFDLAKISSKLYCQLLDFEGASLLMATFSKKLLFFSFFLSNIGKPSQRQK